MDDVGCGVDFSFARWLMIGIPVGLLLLILCYFMLTKLIFPVSAKPIEGVKELLDERWRILGKLSRPELMVLVVFSLTVFLWVFAVPINNWFGTKVLNNTSIAMMGGVLMFVTPVKWKEQEMIISWKSAQKLPWGILILFGGGLTLAAGLEKAGIIALIARYAAELPFDHLFVIVLMLSLVALFLTEVMSNVALVTVLLPVVFGIAEKINVDPLLLTIPVTLSASCAFMMPISTPPNAVVYSSGMVSVKEMMKAGIWMNMAAVVVISVLSYLLFG
ncbi:MAG: SLC13 family permease [Salibacteraceae bacterium]